MKCNLHKLENITNTIVLVGGLLTLVEALLVAIGVMSVSLFTEVAWGVCLALFMFAYYGEEKHAQQNRYDNNFWIDKYMKAEGRLHAVLLEDRECYDIREYYYTSNNIGTTTLDILWGKVQPPEKNYKIVGIVPCEEFGRVKILVRVPKKDKEV